MGPVESVGVYQGNSGLLRSSTRSIQNLYFTYAAQDVKPTEDLSSRSRTSNPGFKKPGGLLASGLHRVTVRRRTRGWWVSGERTRA